MNSFKLKLLFIVLLIIANLFFIIRYKDYKDTKTYFSKEETENAKILLEKNGINIDFDCIPKEKNSLYVFKVYIANSKKNEVADKILADKASSFTLPEGVNFTNSKESLTFYTNGNISYTTNSFEIGSFDLDKIFAGPQNDLEAEKLKKRISDIFQVSYSSEYTKSFKVISYGKNAEVEFIRLRQTINGIEINGNDILFAYHDKKPVYINGKVFIFENATPLITDDNDAVNILLLIEKQKYKIVGMDRIYYPVYDENKDSFLTPSYLITYENGANEIYDATSGIKRK